MPNSEDIALMSHLMRRAGFGTTRDELEEYAARSYESVVDELINPERFPEFETDVLERFYGESGINMYPSKWVYRMVNSHRPLEEKMVLMWHQIFATSYSKDGAPWASGNQIDLFRRIGLSDFRTILVELSREPLMLSWLDNEVTSIGV